MELAAAELRQIIGGKRLPRGGVYVPGPKPGMTGPPQVGHLHRTMMQCDLSTSLQCQWLQGRADAVGLLTEIWVH